MRNVNENNSEDRIVIIPNPLSSTNKIENFRYVNIEEGGALTSFCVEYGFDNKKIKTNLTSKVFVFSLDYLISSKLIIDKPNLIKLDVDGDRTHYFRGCC